MIKLSTMQRKVYDKLVAYRARTSAYPELAQFARELDIHYVSLKQHLQALDKKGYLTFESRGRGQSPRLRLPLQAIGVPVLGSIPAGPLSEAIEHAEGYLPLNASSNHFALRVSGDSMADLIQDSCNDPAYIQANPKESAGLASVELNESQESDTPRKSIEWSLLDALDNLSNKYQTCVAQFSSVLVELTVDELEYSDL
jgi:repressor LexA